MHLLVSIDFIFHQEDSAHWSIPPLSWQPLVCSEHCDFYLSLLHFLSPEFYLIPPPLEDHFLSVQKFRLAKEGEVWWAVTL